MTDREKVLIQREAYAKALRSATFLSNETIARDAEKVFPMSKVTRRRVVTMPDGVEFRVVPGGDTLQYRSGAGLGHWMSTQRKRSDIAALLALFDNPDELVDVE